MLQLSRGRVLATRVVDAFALRYRLAECVGHDMTSQAFVDEIDERFTQPVAWHAAIASKSFEEKRREVK